MPLQFPQPYRGQPRPKYPRPKRQVRNLRLEKKIRIFILGMSILVMILIFRILLILYYANPDNITLALMIVMPVLFLFVTFAIADGLKSINKFREGWDVNISDESEKEDGGQSKFE